MTHSVSARTSPNIMFATDGSPMLVDRHHSHTFPAKSETPSSLSPCGYIPTAVVLPRFASFMFAFDGSHSTPHGHARRAPQAMVHSRSVGRRTV
jgi:hypothetical protein